MSGTTLAGSGEHSPELPPPLEGRGEVNWRLGSERSILMSEFWVPLWQKPGQALWADLRLMGDDRDNREGNLGLGYREVVGSGSYSSPGGAVVGAHVWLDRRITERGSTFHQLTAGIEWLGERVDVLANGYAPLSDGKRYTIPNPDAQGPAIVGTGIVVDTPGALIEEPQAGLDLELGFELGAVDEAAARHTDSFRIYGGGYYFDSENTESVSGWRVRSAIDITPDIQIGARFQRDDVRGSQGFLEATIRFPFGQKRSFRKYGVHARLDEAPERDIDIVTNETVTDTGDRVPVLNKETDAPQQVITVDNTAEAGGDGSAEKPFNALSDAEAAAGANAIIYVRAGDGAATGQDQGITLDNKGQWLIGSGVDFVFDGSRFKTANSQPVLDSNLIAPATSAPVISNTNADGDGITVSADDVTVAGVTVSGASRDGIVVRADGAGASATNVTIEDVSATGNRMGIYIHGTNSGAVSAKVQRSATTSNSQHGIAVYDDTDGTFEADLGGGSMGSVGNNVLAGNTLEDLAVEYDGRTLAVKNNWWGQSTGPDQDDPSDGQRPQIYYGAPINDGLVGHWTFDSEWNSATLSYDRSGEDHHGAFVNNPQITNEANRQALSFSANNENVSVTNFSGSASTQLTASAWFRTNDAAAQFLTSGNTRLVLQLGGSKPKIKIFNNSVTSVNAAINAADNSLHHIVAVWDGTDVSMYLDGGFINSKKYVDVWAAQNSLQLGTYIFGPCPASCLRSYTGILDDVRFYNQDLSAAEISELYRMDTSSMVTTSGFLTSAP